MANRTRRKNRDYAAAIFGLILGIILGWMTRNPGNVYAVAEVVTSIGLWIFLSSLLAHFTTKQTVATIGGGVLGVGTVIGIVLREALRFDMSRTRGALLEGFDWIPYAGLFCVLLLVVAFLSWKARARDWIGALSGAVPISILIAEAVGAFPSIRGVLVFDIISAVVLFFLIFETKNKKLMALPYIAIFSFLLIWFGIIAKLMETTTAWL